MKFTIPNNTLTIEAKNSYAEKIANIEFQNALKTAHEKETIYLYDEMFPTKLTAAEKEYEWYNQTSTNFRKLIDYRFAVLYDNCRIQKEIYIMQKLGQSATMSKDARYRAKKRFNNLDINVQEDIDNHIKSILTNGITKPEVKILGYHMDYSILLPKIQSIDPKISLIDLQTKLAMIMHYETKRGYLYLNSRFLERVWGVNNSSDIMAVLDKENIVNYNKRAHAYYAPTRYISNLIQTGDEIDIYGTKALAKLKKINFKRFKMNPKKRLNFMIKSVPKSKIIKDMEAINIATRYIYNNYEIVQLPEQYRWLGNHNNLDKLASHYYKYLRIALNGGKYVPFKQDIDKILDYIDEVKKTAA